MPRPKSKDELIALSQANYKKLLDLVDSFSVLEQKNEFPVGTLNRNIGDVLAHLHHWHLMVLDWCTIGIKGEKPDMPAKGYTWKTVPELNRVIREKYKNESLTSTRKNLDESFQSIQKAIHNHSNQELFEKKYYKWTGTTSLGSYLISATSSHYDWAYKLIKKAKK
jgi:hypothetical protein